MTVTVPGHTTISGKPKAILRVMQDARIFDPPTKNTDEYIRTIQNAAWQFFGIGLYITGETEEEKAESLLREMARNNMITIEEETK